MAVGLRFKLIALAVLTIFTGLFMVFQAIAVANGPAHANPHIHDAVYHPVHRDHPRLHRT